VNIPRIFVEFSIDAMSWAPLNTLLAVAAKMAHDLCPHMALYRMGFMG
jgi:hypothetical protein